MKQPNAIFPRSIHSFAMGSFIVGCMTANVFGWQASGTVKNNSGTALVGVTVTVQDSSAGLKATTDANGAFTIGNTLGILESARPQTFFAQVVGHELVLQCPKDGPIDLSLVDASGRALWSARTVASQGTARSALPSVLGNGAIFLRIGHSNGIQLLAVSNGPDGLTVARPASRALAANAVLVFKLTGYDDTTYAMTSANQTGIAVVMAAPTTCDLPSKPKWKDGNGGPLAGPKNGWSAIKDFTHVYYNGQHIVYMTYYQGGYKSAAMAPFTDWSNAKDATQTATNTGVAPELMYFSPKKIWVDSKQWCSNGSFCYMTATDPTKPSTFADKGPLLTETITDQSKAPIDQTLICDDKNCYIFYADDNGRIYRGSMPIGNFPGLFTGTKKILEESTPARLFEAVEVYRIKGQQKYLMIVECGYPRYFRAFTATDLGGTWTSLVGSDTQASPFAGKNNVTNGWSDDISHGDLVRSTYDETKTIDPCNLQLIYQGYKPPFSGNYGDTPYQLGLLTLQK
jgi:hypothetical protein